MALSDYLTKDRILFNFTAGSKEEVLDKLADMMSASCNFKDPDAIRRKLKDREDIGSTGIGHGIALPHAQVAGVKELYLGAAVSPDGVDFDSLDGVPVKLMFCLIASAGTDKSYLGVLAHLARILRDEANINWMLNTTSPDEFLGVLRAMDA